MSEKVKITREFAEQLDLARGNNSDAYIVQQKAKYSIFPDVELDVLIRALYIGYEVEETPEERIKRIFNMPNKAAHYKAGVIDALDALNMKIEGVNT